MKQFKDFKSACNWLKDVVNACADDTRSAVAEQVYKDSREFTYYSDQGNTTHMYDTGQEFSDFQKGYIIERTPYVRRRYYEGGKPGSGNRRAEPRWFEKTWDRYKKDYQDMCINVFKKVKEGK